MAEIIIEVIFDLLFEGMIDATGNRRVPFVVRLLLGAILVLAYLALAGLIMFVAICSGSIPLIIVLALAVIAATSAVGVKTVRTLAKR